MITAEHGKVFSDAQGEVMRGIDVVEFACGIPQLLKGDYTEQVSTGIDNWTMRQPLGVVAGITPFNFPFMVPCWMFPVAIACGNTFILKPSERDPSPSLLMAELLQRAGLPDGVFNVVQGDKTVVDALLDASGREGAVLRRIDADRAVHLRDRRAPRQARAGAGRREEPHGRDARRRHRAGRRRADRRGLRLGRRALHGDLGGGAGGRRRRQMLPELAERARTLVDRQRHEAGCGDGPDRHAAGAAAHRGLHRRRRRRKARRWWWTAAACQVSGHENGFFTGGTLFDHVTPEMRIYKEEIFGPVLACVRVHDFTAAVDLVNAHEFGNGVACYTSDGNVAREFARRIQVGMVGINVPIPGADGVARLRRLEEEPVRRHARLWRGRRALLHEAEERSCSAGRRASTRAPSSRCRRRNSADATSRC